MKKPKRPKDTNQLAKAVVEIATGGRIDETSLQEKGKNPHAIELGRLGGLKGGKARAEKLTQKRRIEIAKKAVKARWKKKR